MGCWHVTILWARSPECSTEPANLWAGVWLPTMVRWQAYGRSKPNHQLATAEGCGADTPGSGHLQRQFIIDFQLKAMPLQVKGNVKTMALVSNICPTWPIWWKSNSEVISYLVCWPIGHSEAHTNILQQVGLNLQVDTMISHQRTSLSHFKLVDDFNRLCMPAC